MKLITYRNTGQRIKHLPPSLNGFPRTWLWYPSSTIEHQLCLILLNLPTMTFLHCLFLSSVNLHSHLPKNPLFRDIKLCIPKPPFPQQYMRSPNLLNAASSMFPLNSKIIHVAVTYFFCDHYHNVTYLNFWGGLNHALIILLPSALLTLRYPPWSLDSEV